MSLIGLSAVGRDRDRNKYCTGLLLPVVSCPPAFLRHPPVAKRQFFDDDGVPWIVWDVHPDDLGRVTYDRRSGPLSVEAARSELSRRNERAVHPDLRNGWLCFQAAAEKRRLTPIPADWSELPEPTLRQMLRAATPAPPADGRIARPSAGA